MVFLLLSCPRKFQGFWKLWARNCGWRPVACEKYIFITWMSKYVCALSSVAPWPVARQAPLSRAFPRQEYFRLLEVLLTQGSSDSHLPHLSHWQVGAPPLAPPGAPYKPQSCPVNGLAHYLAHLCVPSQSSERLSQGSQQAEWRSSPRTLSLFSFSFERMLSAPTDVSS